MAIGSYAKFVGSGTDDTTTLPAQDVWTDWDFEGASGWVETDADTLVTESTSNFTLAEAGYYLIIYRIHFEVSHANRLNMRIKLRGGASGVTDIPGSQGAGYARNAGNDEIYMGGQLIYKAAASDVIDIQFQRDLGDGTVAGAWIAVNCSITFIRLSDTRDAAYGIYGDTTGDAPASNFLNGTTWLNIQWNTVLEETDIRYIEKTADNDITLHRTGRYLVCYSVALYEWQGVGRTQRIGRALLNSTVIPASHSVTIMRNGGNGNGSLNCMFIVDATAGDILHIQGQRGVADIDADVRRRAPSGVGETGLEVMRIHAETELIVCRDGTANQDQDGNLASYNVNAARDIIYNDTASFTAPAITDINCVKTSSVLCWANVAGGSLITATTGTRLSIAHELELAGTNLEYGRHGTYQRNASVSNDCFNNCSHPYAVEDVTAGDDFQCEFFDDGDGGSGADEATTSVDEVGMFAINLDTLEDLTADAFSTAKPTIVNS